MMRVALNMVVDYPIFAFWKQHAAGVNDLVLGLVTSASMASKSSAAPPKPSA
jgi:hypothetical protein